MSTQNYTIRTYEPGDDEAINDGFNQVFGTQRSLDEWRWKFQDDLDRICLAFDDDGAIVAHYGAVRVRLKYGDQIYEACQPVDVYRIRRPSTAEAPVFAECGLYYVQRVVGEHDLPFFYGFPGEHSRHVGVRHLGYNLGEKLEMWRKPVLAQRSPFWRFNKKIDTEPPSAQHIDDLWSRASARYPVVAVRDSTRLTQRYISRSGANYLYVKVVRGGTLRALAIVLQAGAVIKWIDLVWDGHRSRDLVALDRQVSEIARSLEAEACEMWLRGDPDASVILQSQGWAKTADPDQPYLVGRSFREELSADEFVEKCYVTLGDSDLV